MIGSGRELKNVKIHRAVLAGFAAGVAGAGLLLGAGVANGAARTGGGVYSGYTMMPGFLQGQATVRGTQDIQTVVPTRQIELHRQTMLAAHRTMPGYRLWTGSSQGTGVPWQSMMGAAYDFGTGGPTSSFLPQGASPQGASAGAFYGSMMGGY